MKKILCLIILSILAFNAFGQIHKIEKKTYGLLDSIYYMNGSDTVYTESFHKNGLLRMREWKQDSFEVFNTQGKIVSRTKNHIKHSFGYYFRDINNLIYHQHKEYYPDGRLLKEDYWQGDTFAISKTYTPSGEILHAETLYKHKAADGKYNQFYYSKIDETGQVKSIKRDTLLNISIDSTFMNGRLNRTDDLLGYSIFDENGKIGFQWKIDSNRLHPDKDNGDCLYGFRNMRGDWVIPPQYDNVQTLIHSYFIVNKNEKYGIIDDFAKIFLPSEFDFLGELIDEDNDFPDFTKVNEYLTLQSHSFKKQGIPLKYRLGGKYGVIDFKGRILLPPQYDNVRKMQGDTFEVRIGQKWGLVDSRGRIIVQPKYYRVDFTYLPNIFKVIDTTQTYFLGHSRTQEIKGLVNDKGQTILDIRFNKLIQNVKMPSVFKVSTFIENIPMNGQSIDGIYDIKKGWILDTSYRDQNNGVYEVVKKHPLIADSIISKTYGYINNNLKILLPFEYDHIKPLTKKTYSAENCKNGNVSTCNVSKTILICQKDKKFGIFDEITAKWLIPLKYDYMKEFVINYSNNFYDDLSSAYQNNIRLLTLKDGKWRWIDENDHLLSPDLMDYAGSHEKENSYYHLFTILNNKVSFPNELYYPQDQPLEEIIDYNKRYRNKANDLIKLKDYIKGEMLINQKGVLVVPPQYSIVSTFGNHALVKDKLGNQLLIDEEGNKRSFLSNYKIHLAQINEGVVIVEDTLKKTFGVVSPEGKVLLPSRYYAVSAVDTSGVIWAKEKSPVGIEPTIDKKMSAIDYYKTTSDCYALKSVDSAWQMFNTKGQLLTPTLFAFPFEIYANQGIGVVRQSSESKEYKAGIWRTTDGVNILPPQYDHIFFDDYNKLYLIYKKGQSGLKVGICDTTGRILIEPKFDRMSTFNGDYAFVQEDWKLGVVMRNGQYKIPPQYNAFKNTSEDIDALMSAYQDSTSKEGESPNYSRYGYFKIEFEQGDELNIINQNNIDSLSQDENRIIKNLIIEKKAEGYFIDGEFVAFDRSPISIFSRDIPREKYSERFGLNSTVYNLNNINVHKKIMGFVLGEDENRMPRDCGNHSFEYSYHNFMQQDDNTWQEVGLDDLLVLNPANNLKINQLFVDKLRDVKDANIDCSNSDKYFETMKNDFYIFPKGIQFYSSQARLYGNINHERVKVFFTWDELKGFLKKR